MAKTWVVMIFGPVKMIDQQLGTDSEHMVGQIACHIVYRGEKTETFANVKQVTGTAYEDLDNIEVKRPEGYRGPLDFHQFQQMAQQHYKGTISKVMGMVPPGSSVKFETSQAYFGNSFAMMECEDAPATGGW